MSGIAGIIRFDGGPVEPGPVARMTAAMPYRGPDGIRHWSKGSAVLGHCMLRTTPEALEETQPLANEDESVVLVLDGRVDNWIGLRQELLRRGKALRDRSDAELVLRAYEVWGQECLARFEGDFAFVLWDERSRTAFCARDRMGNRPFHYHWRDGVFSFASDLRALLVLPWVKQELNEGFLAEFLANEWHSRDETFWVGIRRLVAAHRMVLGPEGGQPACYWEPDLWAVLPYTKESDVVDAYREILVEQVRRCSRSQVPVAFEVSGGLDSSALFCVAAGLLESSGLPAPGIEGYTLNIDDGSAADELAYARAVGRFLDRRIREVPPSRMPPLWFEERARFFRDFPGYRNDTMFHDLRLEAHRNGCRVIIAGEGGDQWLGGERTYYAEALQEGRWGLALRHLAEDARTSGVRRAFYWALRQGVFPLLPPLLALRLRRARARMRGTRWEGTGYPWLSPRLVEALEPRVGRLARAAGPPFRREGQKRQLETLLDPFGDHATELTERLSAILGMENRYPLLSPAVVQFAFSVPERLRLRADRNKDLHVRALEGSMPRCVLDRKGKAEFSSIVREQLVGMEREFVEELPRDLQAWVSPEGLRGLYDAFAATTKAGRPAWVLESIHGCSGFLG